ncbi:hypothetical protein F5884DRAFT_745526 [Xylogone sp. PMI_703]|nr:hypothetical protein F5884DRAFT_745526 [Xylogone sp. PMI_703]
MANIHVTASSILSSFLPRLSPSIRTARIGSLAIFSRQLSHPLIPALNIAVPAAIHLNVPSLLGGIWESILRAVPKKKTSHMKKRHRQMAGKGMKDVTSLNRCSACGHIKRAHVLCPYCVKGSNASMHLGQPFSNSAGRTPESYESKCREDHIRSIGRSVALNGERMSALRDIN